jgi:ADP-heptose:LPS heptosyltransferase
MMVCLLIIRPGAIGDTLVTLPLLQALRMLMPDLHITFVGNAAVLPFLRATGMVDEIASFEDRQWGQLFLPVDQQDHTKLYALLGQFNVAMCWLRDSDGVVRQNLAAAGVERIAVAPGRPVSDEYPHIVAYLTRCMATLFPALPEEIVWQPPESYAWQPNAGRTLVIHPGSGGKQKCWPIEYYATLTILLHQRGIPIVVLSGPAESDLLPALRSLLADVPAERLQFLASASLLDLALLLRTCRAYLGNDSGITHLAALLGVPTIALFGPSDPVFWCPIGPRVMVVHEEKLEEIKPQRVLNLLWI